jgi:hypothetical protein
MRIVCVCVCAYVCRGEFGASVILIFKGPVCVYVRACACYSRV